MDMTQHLLRAQQFLETRQEGVEFTVKIEDWNVLYSQGNDCCGVPLPDWITDEPVGE